MPEQPDPGAPDKESWTPAISDEEAARLRLTNYELMRARWSGELPVRVEQMNEETRRGQVRPGPKFFLTPEEKARPTEIPTFKKYEEFSAWSRYELGLLSTRVRHAVHSPGVVSPQEALVQADRWTLGAKGWSF